MFPTIITAMHITSHTYQRMTFEMNHRRRMREQSEKARKKAEERKKRDQKPHSCPFNDKTCFNYGTTEPCLNCPYAE